MDSNQTTASLSPIVTTNTEDTYLICLYQIINIFVCVTPEPFDTISSPSHSWISFPHQFRFTIAQRSSNQIKLSRLECKQTLDHGGTTRKMRCTSISDEFETTGFAQRDGNCGRDRNRLDFERTVQLYSKSIASPRGSSPRHN
jgi:hypothetical protein